MGLRERCRDGQKEVGMSEKERETREETGEEESSELLTFSYM